MLNHPNLLHLDGMFETKNSFYVVFQPLEETLYGLLKNKSLELIQMKQIIKKLFDGVSQMHKKGIMHRNISPETIMMRKLCDPVLTSFGQAELVSSENYVLTNVGTAGYMAPELFTSDRYTQACDIFSLGAIFFLMYFSN